MGHLRMGNVLDLFCLPMVGWIKGRGEDFFFPWMFPLHSRQQQGWLFHACALRGQLTSNLYQGQFCCAARASYRAHSLEYYIS